MTGSPLRADRGEEVVAIGDARVAIAYDPDGETWYVRTSSVPGLVAEAGSREELLEDLPRLIGGTRLP